MLEAKTWPVVTPGVLRRHELHGSERNTYYSWYGNLHVVTVPFVSSTGVIWRV